MAQLKTVIEFGTSKIVCLIDSSSIKGMNLPGSSCIRYDGIKGGRWRNSEAIAEALTNAVENAEKKSRRQAHSAIIGIPGSFSHVVSSDAEMYIDSETVAEEHISELAERAKPGSDANWILADVRPIYFLTDREDLYVEPPIGIRTRTLKAMFSYIYASREFTDSVIDILNGMHITPEKFVSEAYAQAVHFIPQNDRLSTAVIADIGYRETAVSAVYGDAVLATSMIPIGGLDFVNDICSTLRVDMTVAESLKRGHVFGIQAERGNKVYGKDNRGRMIAFDQMAVKDVLEASVDKLIRQIGLKIDQFVRGGLISQRKAKLFLMGAGLATRGAETYFQGKLRRKVVSADSGMGTVMSPVYNTALSLLDNNLDSVYHLTGNIYKNTTKTKLGRLFK